MTCLSSLCAAHDVSSFESDVVTNYAEESDSDHTRERFRPRTSSSGHRYRAIMSGLGICGRKSDHSIPTACVDSANEINAKADYQFWMSGFGDIAPWKAHEVRWPWPGLLVFLEISVGGGRFRGVPSCILFLSDKGKHFPLKHGGHLSSVES